MHAEVAQLAEHDLAQVGVRVSSSAQKNSRPCGLEFFFKSTSHFYGEDALVAELVDAQDLKSCLP
jgi:hypothetical protein